MVGGSFEGVGHGSCGLSCNRIKFHSTSRGARPLYFLSGPGFSSAGAFFIYGCRERRLRFLWRLRHNTAPADIQFDNAFEAKSDCFAMQDVTSACASKQ